MADIYGEEREGAMSPRAETQDQNVVDLDEPTAAAPADPGVVDLDKDGDEGLPDHAIEQADGSVRLPLKFPVTLKFKTRGSIREEHFAELVFHRLTGADMRVIKGAKQEHMTPVAAARSTRIHEGRMNAVYDRMDAVDTTSVDLVVMHFLGGGLKISR